MPSPPLSPERSIALVGLMGAGKSTVGRRLARRLGLPFADADAEIEAAAGLSVAEIFERFGEAHFRDGERRVIARLVEGPPRVIATGGGAFMDAGTRALILARCTAIWLDGDVDILAERVGRRGHRPLLKGKDAKSLLSGLAEARNPIYAEAHIAVRTGAQPHEKVVDRIVAALAG
jgi:shikimate kinase